jgi:hypothetical protein
MTSVFDWLKFKVSLSVKTLISVLAGGLRHHLGSAAPGMLTSPVMYILSLFNGGIQLLITHVCVNKRCSL